MNSVTYLKRNRTLIGVLFALAITAIIVGSFCDLAISKSIFSSRNIFSIIMAIIGTLPIQIALAFFAGSLFVITIRSQYIKFVKALLIFLSFLTIFIASYLLGSEISSVNALNIPQYKIVVGLIGLVFNSCFFLLGVKLNYDNNNQRLVFFCLIMILSVALIQLFGGSVIKELLHRPRYRVLVDKTQYSLVLGESNFKNWWETFSEHGNWIGKGNITAEEFRSFPSGHACSSSIGIIFVIYASLLNEKIRKHKMMYLLIAIIICLLTCFSRILIGAHFLSDIGFGLLISTVIFAIINEMFIYFYKKGFFVG